LMIHFSELDEHVPPESYNPVKAALGPLSNVDIFMYENSDHGFNRFGYPPYHQPSADLALERTLSFLNTELA
ncbi:MAG: dienelactone hydrolase family protein, partial [Rhodospirillales bacterium]